VQSRFLGSQIDISFSESLIGCFGKPKQPNRIAQQFSRLHTISWAEDVL
jgi:hypothetical protein